MISNGGKVEYDIKASLIEHTCTNAYYLATYTNLFGRRLNILDSEIFLNEDILFIAALLLRTHWLTTYNMSKVINYYLQFDHFTVNSEVINSVISLQISADHGSIICYAKCTHSFYSLFNHSCDPNVGCLIANKNKTIVYAIHPITKGSQVFLI